MMDGGMDRMAHRNIITGIIAVTILLFTMSTGHAWLAVCGNSTDTKDASAGLQAFQMNATKAQVENNPNYCGVGNTVGRVSEVNTDATIALLSTPNFEQIRYRVIPDGVEFLQVVEKGASALAGIQADKDAVTAEAAKLSTALNSSTCKGDSIDSIKTIIANARAAAHTQVSQLAGTSLTQIKGALDVVVDRLYNVADEAASCLYAKAPVK
jgi:hypothetical protein